MSWWGTHPVISKTVAREKLPGACKVCIYIRRLPVKLRKYFDVSGNCERCGLPRVERFKPL